MSEDLIELEPVTPGRRRRYTPDQKRALLDEAALPGGSVSQTARRYGIAPSLLFHWKRVMDDASEKGLKANERVVPESELKKAEARIKALERALGRKTMESEILQEAVAIAKKKKWISDGNSSGEGSGP